MWQLIFSATETSRMTQLTHLWEFLNNHREIALGYNKSIQARDHSRRMWERAAEILNSTGDGATKPASEWSKVSEHHYTALFLVDFCLLKCT